MPNSMTKNVFLMLLAGSFGLVCLLSNNLLYASLSLQASLFCQFLIVFTSSSLKQQEAGFKFFLNFALASILLLIGSAIFYSSTQSFQLDQASLNLAAANKGWLEISALFLLIGFCVTVGFFPGHAWMIDVIETTPALRGLFILSLTKILFAGVAIKLFSSAALANLSYWPTVFCFLSGLAVIIGSLLAIAQSSVKRLLAYGALAECGLWGVLVFEMTQLPSPAQELSLAICAISYLLSTAGLMTIIQHLERVSAPNLQIDDLAGILKQHRWPAIGLSILCLNLIGAPFGLGFLAKLHVFQFSSTTASALLQILLFVALVAPISYYGKLLRKTIGNGQNSKPIHWRSSTSALLSVSLCCSMLILLGTVMYPSMISFYKTAISYFGGP